MAEWRDELLAALSKSPEQIEAERQEALAWARRRLRSAREHFACASDEKRWLRGYRNEVISKAWDAGATRREIADASGVPFTKISEIVGEHVREQSPGCDPNKLVSEWPIESVVYNDHLTLIENGLRTVGDLIARPQDWLLSLPGIGKRRADDIMRKVARALAVEAQGGEDGYAKWVEANAERFVVFKRWEWDKRQYFQTKTEAVASVGPDDGECNVGAEFDLHYAHVQTLGKQA
jgi:hypothetical protein